jgi:aerobic carbon-monoxide dehydrogenase large subunit
VSTSTAGRFVGQSVKRREDPRLLTGHGRYVDDVMLPGMLHCAFVRSDVARGRIVRVDTDAARKLDGVVAVLTANDLNHHAGNMQPTMMMTTPGAPLRPLADGDVRFVGEPIVLIVAESRYIAEDGAELVVVEIDGDRAVVDMERALDVDAPIVHPELGTNLAAEMAFPVAPELEALLRDGNVVRRTFRQHRHTPVPMETRGIVVAYEPAEGTVNAWMSTQNPHEAKHTISRMLGVPSHLVRVQAHDVGGGFGQKFFTPREELVVALAARRLGRTLKWIEDRRENLIASNHARADLADCTFALDADGRLLGTYIDHLEDAGSFPVGATGGAGALVGLLFTGPYKCPLASLRTRAVWTNTCGRGAYRGPWMFETVAREQMVDAAAREIGMDPLEWRRRNVVPTAELPYTLPTGLPLDMVSPSETLEQAVEIIGYEAFRAEQQRAFTEDGRLLGVGLGLYVEPSTGMMDPMGTETAVVRVDPSGQVTVALGTGSHGQGIETTMAQVVAEELGIDFDEVTVVQGDSAVTAYGRGTGGSGTAVIAGNSCRNACAVVRAKAIGIAAHLMEAAPGDLEIVDAQIAVRGTPTRSIAWSEVAHIAHLETARLPEGMEAGLEATATFKAPPFSWSNACHACTVEVDRATGVVSILRYVVSEDCGVMINPMIVEGQVAGGVAQGIGGTLYEHFVYDDDGNPLTTTFMDYLLPTATEVPNIEYGHVETPSPTPGGHKGMGEGGAIGSPPAIFNAVADALALVGASIDRTPLSPDAILHALG